MQPDPPFSQRTGNVGSLSAQSSLGSESSSFHIPGDENIPVLNSIRHRKRKRALTTKDLSDHQVWDLPDDEIISTC